MKIIYKKNYVLALRFSKYIYIKKIKVADYIIWII